VSPDDVKSHRKFKEKYALPYTLLADTDHAVAEAYGVWQEKKLFGVKYWGVVRSTFVVGADGRIARAFRGVKVEGHAEEVLEAVRDLRGRASAGT
jgi:peroxiredoxin Q/BCP